MKFLPRTARAISRFRPHIFLPLLFSFRPRPRRRFSGVVPFPPDLKITAPRPARCDYPLPVPTDQRFAIHPVSLSVARYHLPTAVRRLIIPLPAEPRDSRVDFPALRARNPGPFIFQRLGFLNAVLLNAWNARECCSTTEWCKKRFHMRLMESNDSVGQDFLSSNTINTSRRGFQRKIDMGCYCGVLV